MPGHGVPLWVFFGGKDWRDWEDWKTTAGRGGGRWGIYHEIDARWVHVILLLVASTAVSDVYFCGTSRAGMQGQA